jgi:hypothetical protein
VVATLRSSKGENMQTVHPDIQALVKLLTRLEKKKIKRVQTGNPKKAGTAARSRWTSLFKSAKQGASVADYISAKGNPRTLKNAIAKGYIELV